MTHELFKGVFVTIAFFLGTVFVPVIGVLISTLTPLPIIIYYYQYGRKVALQLITITVVVVTIVIVALRIPSLFIYLLQLLLLGFICGELLTNNFNVPKIIVAACLAALALNAVTIYMFGREEKGSLMETLEKGIKQNFEQSMRQYKDRGMTEDQFKWLTKSLDTIVPWLARLFPAIVAVATAIIIWLNLILAKQFLYSRLRQIPPPLQYLNQWKTPDPLVWIVICAGFGVFLPASSIKILSYNVLLVMAAVYFFQGLAIIAYYFETKKTPKSIRFLVYFFIFFQQVLTIAVSVIGLVDVWANFRRLPEAIPPQKKFPDNK